MRAYLSSAHASLSGLKRSDQVTHYIVRTGVSEHITKIGSDHGHLACIAPQLRDRGCLGDDGNCRYDWRGIITR